MYRKDGRCGIERNEYNDWDSNLLAVDDTVQEQTACQQCRACDDTVRARTCVGHSLVRTKLRLNFNRSEKTHPHNLPKSPATQENIQTVRYVGAIVSYYILNKPSTLGRSLLLVIYDARVSWPWPRWWPRSNPDGQTKNLATSQLSCLQGTTRGAYKIARLDAVNSPTLSYPHTRSFVRPRRPFGPILPIYHIPKDTSLHLNPCSVFLQKCFGALAAVSAVAGTAPPLRSQIACSTR